jgi:signal transduction histidine kinase
MQVDGTSRYPIEVEAAVYFCVLEALQNAAKYAGASSIAVTIAERDGGLSFEVGDDGAGFDDGSVVRGSGLQNMHDRLSTLGGKLQVIGSPGRGTRVVGWVPIYEAAEAKR